MNNKTRRIVFGAFIGAVYAALTILLAPISYGPLQIRISEALTILPFFSPYSIVGLFIGCIIANIFGGNGIMDIVFGSLATLIAAIITYYIGKMKFKLKAYLAPLPAVIINAIVVGAVLYYTQNIPLVATMLWVGLGELIACYVLGIPLLMVIDKNHKVKEYLA